MNKLRTTSWFLLLIILLATLVSFTMAQETPAAAGDQLLQHGSLSGGSLVRSSAETQIELATTTRHSLSLPAVSIDMSPAVVEDPPPEPATPVDSLAVKYPDGLSHSQLANTSSPAELELTAGAEQQVDFSDRFVGVPQPSPSPSAAGATCKQLLVNTKLDVGSGGSIAPWAIYDQIVYFSDVDFVSAQHSLLFEDNDSGDPSPTQDAFGQAFSMPANLTEVSIKYETASLHTNSADDAFGNLWTVDADGFPDQFLLSWEVGESAGAWQTQTVKITDKAVLQALEGKDLVILLYNRTTASTPNEVVYFDDITLDACASSYIIVKKETNPAGAAQIFTFDPSWGSNFKLAGGGSKMSPDLAPGTHSVRELPQSGWDLSSATCSDGSKPNSISLQLGETVTCTFRNVKQAAPTCGDVLVNSALDIVEFGDGTGTAEPWSIIAPIVYYTKNPDMAFDGYSLFLEDGDSGDPSPGIDMLAQGFQMPGNLTEVNIEYQRATLDTNATDDVFGELWLLDEDWVLHLDQSDKYFVFGWTVSESEAAWGKAMVPPVNDPQLLSKLNGQKAAILLFNVTDGGGSKEIILFDEVYVEACSKGAPAGNRIFLPSIMKAAKVSGPICAPPSENPADQWHSNRGLVQTNATCNSTLSNVDRADYYTFKPTTSGNHTLRLTGLPGGTEWSAMIFVDSASPDYAPGGASDGKCRITQPGSGDKQVVCNLNKGTGYFAKVSSGSTPVSGSYTMRITKP